MTNKWSKNVRTYTGGMALRKRMSNTLSGSLGLEVSGQSAKNYIDAEDVTRESTPWDRLGYDQTAFKLNLTSSLIDSVTVSLLGSWYLKSFDAPENPAVTYAMTSAHGTTVGVDVDWAPSRDWNLFGFYSFDRMKAEIDANGGDLKIDDLSYGRALVSGSIQSMLPGHLRCVTSMALTRTKTPQKG